MELIMDHFQLTAEQQFSIHQNIENYRGRIRKEDLLNLLYEAKRLLKIKERLVENPKNLSFTFSVFDQLHIQTECAALSEQKTEDELFEDYIWHLKLVMIKDNHYKHLIRTGLANNPSLYLGNA